MGLWRSGVERSVSQITYATKNMHQLDFCFRSESLIRRWRANVDARKNNSFVMVITSIFA